MLDAGNNYNNGLNANNNLNNNARFVGIGQAEARTLLLMKRYGKLWEKLCSYENLELAFKRARKHKTLKPYVLEFEKNLRENLLSLRTELLLHSYRPQPLQTFILKDPKTRKISKSEFRDRVVHHALCNMIEPIFEKSFIYDSYANRKGKGTLKALERFEHFKRKATRNNTKAAFALKADIRQYFENVNHEILIKIIKEKISDENAIWLIKRILGNYGKDGRGMPLGNLTSQFFANVYLDKLDWFVKQKLKAKHYIRYVDDFVIMHPSHETLELCKQEIDGFLSKNLKLTLHPDKSKIRALGRGVGFLGYRVFTYHKLLKKSNTKKMARKLAILKDEFDSGKTSYDAAYSSFEGWLAYARQGNTHKLRAKIIKKFEGLFVDQIAPVEIGRLLKKLKKEQSLNNSPLLASY